MNDLISKIPPKLHAGGMGKGKGKPYAIMYGPDRRMDPVSGTVTDIKRYWRLDLDHSHSTLHHLMNQVKKGNLLVQLYNLNPESDEHQQINNYHIGVNDAIQATIKSMGIHATVEKMKATREKESAAEKEESGSEKSK